MNFSAPLSDWPLLVCTNTWRDYAITVRRGLPDSTTAQRIIEYVLPAFARVVSEPGHDFRAGVGLMGTEDPSHCMVFRVFDAGVYRGRPHTVGIVGVLVPWRSARDWPSSAILRRLPCPEPDSDQYPPPQPFLDDLVPCSEEPFNALDNWEACGTPLATDDVVWFCDPPDLTPTILRGKRGTLAVQHSRRWSIGLVAIVIMAGVLAFIAAVIVKWQRPASTVVTEKPHLDDGKQRLVLVSVLIRGRLLDEGRARTATVDELKRIVPPATAIARRNTIELAQKVTTARKGLAAEDVIQVIQGHFKRYWEQAEPEHLADSVPSESELELSLRFLQQYANLYTEVRQFVLSPRTENIDALQRSLEAAASQSLPSPLRQ